MVPKELFIHENHTITEQISATVPSSANNITDRICYLPGDHLLLSTVNKSALLYNFCLNSSVEAHSGNRPAIPDITKSYASGISAY